MHPLLHILYSSDKPEVTGTTITTFADDTRILSVARAKNEAKMQIKKSHTDISIKIANKQVNRRQHCKQFVYVYRFSEGKYIILQVHSLDCLVCDMKAKTEPATVIQKEFSPPGVKICCV